MRLSWILIFFLLFAIKSSGQQDHFLYLQSEDHQPFYARISTQVFSSSENGYLIIPKLKQGQFQMDVGFARDVFPEQHFLIQVANKDLGFQLRNLGLKGWVLSNLRNGEQVQGIETVGVKSNDFAGTRKTDAFSEMLANIVNDSAILYSAVKTTPPPKVVDKALEPEEKRDSVVTPAIADAKERATANTAPTAPNKQPQQTVANDSVSQKSVSTPPPAVVVAETPKEVKPQNTPPAEANLPTKEKPFIVRLSETNSPTSYDAIYLEQYNLTTDTIRISIPLMESVAEQKTVIQQPVKQSAEAAAPTTTPPAVTQKAEPVTPKKTTLQIVNSDCRNFATDYDVDKLRVKIMAENAVDDKIAAAKKYFKTKCFAVKQIRALSELFPSDETRYQSFDAAYPFISDTNEFYTLEDLILNEYYKNRFKAMIHK